MPVPGNKLQNRLSQIHMEGVRADPWATNMVRGLIAEVYDRVNREKGIPSEIAAALVRNPGAIIIRVHLLRGGDVYVPLAISADERNLVYGNSANMVGRPVEIEYKGKKINKGVAYIRADALNLGIREDQAINPFDISGALL